MNCPKILPLFLIPFFLTNCKKETQDGYARFDVKSGKHYYKGSKDLITSKNCINYEIYISDTQIHPPYENIECNGDWNKLFGMSAKLMEHHHENSARFVFRPLYNENKIEIGHYTYYNGKRKMEEWTTKINPDEFYEYEIRFEDNLAKYFFQGALVKEDSIGDIGRIKRPLNPYHGGDCGAYQSAYIIFREK